MGYYAAFEKGKWNCGDFLATRLYYMFSSNKEFDQRKGYIVNGRAPDAPGDGSYRDHAVSCLTYREPLKAGASFSASFSFTGGEPTLFFSSGIQQYGDLLVHDDLIVACFHAGGLKFWGGKADHEKREYAFENIARTPFPVETGTIHTAKMMTEPGRVGVEFGGIEYWEDYPVYPSGYAGLIAWLGENRFYSFSVI